MSPSRQSQAGPLAVGQPTVAAAPDRMNEPKAKAMTELPASQPAVPTLTEDHVREALKQVIDPELFINIVDLGLVYLVDIGEAKEDGRHDVAIEMTLTSPMCPAGPQLFGGAKSAIESLAEVDQVDVRVVMQPPWSQERMSEEARDQLGIF